MSLSDRALKALRLVIGQDREEKESADSPSTLADMASGKEQSVYAESKFGQLNGLLSISNRLLDRYVDYECLTGDTQIVTLAGPKTILSLAKECEADPSTKIPLYTWDGERITVGYGKFARFVKRAKTFRLILDNGFVIRATGDHRFMMRDGTYKTLVDLKVGDSLMPLYLSKDFYGNLCYSENGDYHISALTKADYYRKRKVIRMVAEHKLGRRLQKGETIRNLGDDKNSFDPDALEISYVHGKTERTMYPKVIKALLEAQALCNANCVAQGQKVYTIENSVVVPIAIETYILSRSHAPIVGFDLKTTAMKAVEVSNGQMTQRDAVILSAKLDNGQTLSLTADHRCLTEDKTFKNFSELRKGDKLIGMGDQLDLNGAFMLTSPAHSIVTLLEDPTVVGQGRVFDLQTSTSTFLVSGVVVHNCDLDFPPIKEFDWDHYQSPSPNNHSVAHIEELGEDDVYCLDVPGTHNYVVGDENGGVFTHNSMDEYPDINTTNHYFANDATQPNIDNDRTVWVESKDHVIKGVANTLLRKRLRIDDELFSIAYSLVKYGNNFEEVLVTNNGVVGLNYLPPATVRRVEHTNGALVGFIQDFKGEFSENMADLRQMIMGEKEMAKNVALFEDWQILHMRLRATSRRSPYGYAVSDGARWIWKRLVMLEDATLVYKLTRSPSRFAFYVDVTDQPAKNIPNIMRQVKSHFKKRQIIDPRTGQLSLQMNPLASDEDFFIPVRDGRDIARIENLQGPDYSSMEPIEYFQRKLHAVLKVPREYLGQEGATPGRAILSNEDVRAARTTLNIQKELRSHIEMLVRIDAAARSVDKPWDLDFDVRMTMPSGIYALAQYEVKNSLADFAARIEPYVSKDWIRRVIFKLSDDEIKAIEKGAERDMQMGMAPGGGFGGVPGADYGMEDVALFKRVLEERVSEKDRGIIPSRYELKKRIDRIRREEDRKERQSDLRHHELIDRINGLVNSNKTLARQMDSKADFINLVRHNGLINKPHGVEFVAPGKKVDPETRKPTRG